MPGIACLDLLITLKTFIKLEISLLTKSKMQQDEK